MAIKFVFPSPLNQALKYLAVEKLKNGSLESGRLIYDLNPTIMGGSP